MDYENLLKLSSTFIKSQKSIKGGYYQVGDRVKYVYPLSYSLSLLGWSFIEFNNQSQETEQLLDLFKRGIDFLITCHPTPNELWVEVDDDSYVNSTKITPEKPASDVAFSVSACFAIASLVFKERLPKYSESCYRHSTELFEFGLTYKGLYSNTFPEPNPHQRYYQPPKNPVKYEEELVWACLWHLYHLTQQDGYHVSKYTYYMSYIEHCYPSISNNKEWTMSWDCRRYGIYILLRLITGNDDSASNFLEYWYTKQFKNSEGFIILTDWGSIPHNVNTCFLSLLYSKYTQDNQYTSKALKQMEYIVGHNEDNFSYIVGHGDNYPRNAHCKGFFSTPIKTLGAVVAGPSRYQSYEDKPNNLNNEISLEYNMALSATLIGFIYLRDNKDENGDTSFAILSCDTLSPDIKLVSSGDYSPPKTPKDRVEDVEPVQTLLLSESSSIPSSKISIDSSIPSSKVETDTTGVSDSTDDKVVINIEDDMKSLCIYNIHYDSIDIDFENRKVYMFNQHQDTFKIVKKEPVKTGLKLTVLDTADDNIYYLLTNTTNEPINDWGIEINKAQVKSCWNLEQVSSCKFSSTTYNRTINPGESKEIGFNITCNISDFNPTIYY